MVHSSVTAPGHTDSSASSLIQNATPSWVAFPPPDPHFPEESINSLLNSQIERATSCKGPNGYTPCFCTLDLLTVCARVQRSSTACGRVYTYHMYAQSMPKLCNTQTSRLWVLSTEYIRMSLERNSI